MNAYGMLASMRFDVHVCLAGNDCGHGQRKLTLVDGCIERVEKYFEKSIDKDRNKSYDTGVPRNNTPDRFFSRRN